MGFSDPSALTPLDHEGGRFFSGSGSMVEEEDEIRLVSVGVDIGSSTTHMVLSRIVLERRDNRYIVTRREVTHESEVLLTPYSDPETLDRDALAAFFERQYAAAGVTPDEIDTGALIMTGVAVRRTNSRIIADVFSELAGRFVSVSAGDALETQLSAYGSGAVDRSRDQGRTMNVDIGGGTSKIALCESGEVIALTAIDVGARIVAFDAEGRVVRVEEAARRLADEVGLGLALGEVPEAGGLSRLVERMADHVFAAMQPGVTAPETAALLRLDPLPAGALPDTFSFSGGVAEYVYGRDSVDHGDLGPRLAAAIRARVDGWDPRLEAAEQGIRATVVGASQYTVQVSGTTIFVEPTSLLPVRNVPVLMPHLPLDAEELDALAIAGAVRAGLTHFAEMPQDQPIALCYRWRGLATFGRLDAFCRGVVAGMADHLAAGQPLVLVGDGDVGGLVGIHINEELDAPRPVISIDGLDLQAFDFIDVGELLPATGAVPVVIKSLVFPTSAALGREAMATV
ncbi:ethanolamine utilization protein EutA [Microbacterium sp. MEC084]|uniref:ethanolamine ammonia-lyase reactivating factor EutA n=1 Tax=unclassified Microbacterium TaxID=2609290 RepID=UPI0006FBFBE4|nr:MULTISPECIES: ethanolamine ammonia-lyase reactivating factor EutA [unclassified Microbacterium]KQZ11744.1 ethanolamine utilization protein EutA [Microbacterium sp. Root53]MCD1269376.1 ethanolamine utilization protein EutA [Microbacterium sp. MEC084]